MSALAWFGVVLGAIPISYVIAVVVSRAFFDAKLNYQRALINGIARGELNNGQSSEKQS
jgi:hypothetical protein